MSATRDTLRVLMTPIEGQHVELRGAEALGPRELIGMGGMGAVHAVEQRWLRRIVAVKTPRGGDRLEGNATRLEREARVLARVEHPNILPIYELTRSADGLPQVFVKHVEGETWSQLLEGAEHPLLAEAPMERLAFHIRVLASVCSAVAHANRCGVVHLDLKPSNVMVGQHGEVYLLDWGLAMAAGPIAASWLPDVGRLEHPVGTVTHMAPEMARGRFDQLSARTDVFMLGATLCEVLTGRAPNMGANLGEALKAAAKGTLPLLSSEVPEPLRLICTKAMSRDPEERYADAEVMADALRSWLTHRTATVVTMRALIELRRMADLLAAEVPDTLAIEASHAAAHLGLSEGLARWPDNQAATRGLQELAVMMVTHHLVVGDVLAAEAALEGAVELPEALRREVAEAVERRNENLVEAARLEQEASLRGSSRARLRLAAVQGLGGLALIGALVSYGFDPHFPHWEAHLLFAVFFLCTFPIGAALDRKALLPNEASVRMHHAGIGVGIVMIVNRVMAGLSGLAPAQWLAAETVVLALAAALTGLYSKTPLTRTAGFMLAGTAGCLLWPAGAGLVMMAAALLGLASALLGLNAGSAKAPPS